MGLGWVCEVGVAWGCQVWEEGVGWEAGDGWEEADVGDQLDRTLGLYVSSCDAYLSGDAY